MTTESNVTPESSDNPILSTAFAIPFERITAAVGTLNFVTDEMPILIVNPFEVVQIREHHADRMFLAAGRASSRGDSLAYPSRAFNCNSSKGLARKSSTPASTA